MSAGSQVPQFHHDEVSRKKQIKWDPEHLKEVNNLPFLKRVWARTKHPETCSKCNGLDEYKREIDAKMVEKMRNITAIEEQLRHGKSKLRNKYVRQMAITTKNSSKITLDFGEK